jgi:hypothetical protein
MIDAANDGTSNDIWQDPAVPKDHACRFMSQVLWITPRKAETPLPLLHNPCGKNKTGIICWLERQDTLAVYSNIKSEHEAPSVASDTILGSALMIPAETLV